MTEREAAIVAAYTGFLIGGFSEMHKYINEIMGRPVYTHEMGNEAIAEEIQRLSRDDFVSITIEADK